MHAALVVELLVQHACVGAAPTDARLELLILPSLQLLLVVLLVLLESFLGRFIIRASGLNDIQNGIEDALDIFAYSLVKVKAGPVFSVSISDRVILHDRPR